MSAHLAEPLAASSPPPPHSATQPAGRFAVSRISGGLGPFLLTLIALYLVKQILFVVAFPPFSGHDEVAHFSYLRTVATEGRIPTIPDLAVWRAEVRVNRQPNVDLLPADLYPYCRYALYWHCEPDDPRWSKTPPYIVTYLGQYFPTGLQYVANHPPLYYLAMTPLYWASDEWSTNAQQYLLRFAAIPFGLITVLLGLLLARTLFPGDTFLAVTVPTFIAFQPQISYEAAMVNNDIVAIAGYSLLLWLIVRGIRDRFPLRQCLVVGLVLGLAIVAKSTSLTAAPLIAGAVIATVGWRNVKGWAGRGVAIVAPAALVASPWYFFLYRSYGNFDALPQIAAVQSYWNKPEGSFRELLFSPSFIAMRFRETWGEFGWRVLPLDPELLWVIAVPLVAAVCGLVRFVWLARRSKLERADDDSVLRPVRWQGIALVLLVSACLLAYLAVVHFGTQFSLTQARYFFPVVNAAALLLMLGLRTIIPRRLHRFGQGAVFAALVLLNLLIFTQYVVPYYLAT